MAYCPTVLERDMENPLEELEDTFIRAAEFVQNQTTSGKGKKLSQDVMLQIYGLYKTATIGKCTDPKPGIFDPRGRAKWTAWMNASKLSSEEAMQGYIKLVAEHYVWDPTKSNEHEGEYSPKNSSSFGGNSVSSFPVPEEDADGFDDIGEDILRWVKENRVEEVSNWIEHNNVNFQDKDGLTLLHWSVDRGHLDLTKLLLEKNADISIKDEEGLTPLDYAITCEHESIIKLLQSHQVAKSSANNTP